MYDEDAISFHLGIGITGEDVDCIGLGDTGIEERFIGIGLYFSHRVIAHLVLFLFWLGKFKAELESNAFDGS